MASEDFECSAQVIQSMFMMLLHVFEADGEVDGTRDFAFVFA